MQGACAKCGIKIRSSGINIGFEGGTTGWRLVCKDKKALKSGVPMKCAQASQAIVDLSASSVTC